jgi:hypothetical protein
MGKLVVGAGCKCFINGRDIGIVSGIQWQGITPRERIGGLDTNIPFERGIGASEVGGVISVLKTHSDGGAARMGIAASFRHVIREKYFTLMLVDRITDEVVFRADDCSVDAQSWNVQAKQIVTGTFSWKGITWSDQYSQT